MSDPARPIASLIAKSDKAQQKLAPGTWQHAMLGENLDALRVAAALLSGAAPPPDWCAPDDVRRALRAFAGMIERTEKALTAAAPGTAQHALLKNRLAALRAGQALIGKLLDERTGLNERT